MLPDVVQRSDQCGICLEPHVSHALVVGIELPATVAGTSCFQLLREWDDLVEVIDVVAWTSS